jgi:hypothetical protein
MTITATRVTARPAFLTDPPAPLDPDTTIAVEALFASLLQPSSQPTRSQVAAAVAVTLNRLGVSGCAAVVAGEFAEHPETAVVRMSWVRKYVGVAG